MRSLNSVLINRNYARLWYGQAISTVGDYAFDTTLVLWVATVLGRGEPWAPVAVSGVMITAGAAVFVIGPLAGVFVDRWDRRRTMLGTEVVRGILVALLTVVSFAPLILAAAPSQYIGRVLAVFNPLNQLASIVSMAIAGWLASSALRHFSVSLATLHLGPIDTIFTASGLLVLIAGVYGFTALPRPATAPPAAEPTTQPL